MVSSEDLTSRGLRAYELGRLLAALRIAIVVIPLAAVCLVERTGRELCACLAVILLGTTVWLRWRNRRGVEAVRRGLLAGSLPLAAGLLLERFDLRCGLSGAESFCTTFSVLLGAGAGMLLSLRRAHWTAHLSGSLTAAAVASLAAALGCVRLGTLGIATMLLGITLGTLAGATLSKRTAR